MTRTTKEQRDSLRGTVQPAIGRNVIEISPRTILALLDEIEGAEKGEIAVKPLIWRMEPIPPFGEWLASSVVGLYCIPLSGVGFPLRLRDKDEIGMFDSVEQAKEAGGDHFEKAIRSALYAAPVTAKVTEEMVEAAARAIMKSKGLNPDALHQTFLDSSKADHVDDHGRAYFFGWRQQADHARAALQAALSHKGGGNG